MNHKRTSPLIIILILALPALAAVAHDIWMMTDPARRGWEFSRPFEMSDLGWLWVMYAPESFRFFQDFVPRGLWGAVIDPVLRQPAILALLSIPVIGVIVMVIRIIRPGKGDGFVSFAYRDPDDIDHPGRFKYKRK